MIFDHIFLTAWYSLKNEIVTEIFQKKPQRIQIYYYYTSDRLVCVRFMEEIKDTQNIFLN